MTSQFVFVALGCTCAVVAFARYADYDLGYVDRHILVLRLRRNLRPRDDLVASCHYVPLLDDLMIIPCHFGLAFYEF